MDFDNDFETYTLTAGGGVITGGGGLNKNSFGSLDITGMANTYTGITTLTAGTTSVDTFTNGGVASSLGAATADPANLVFNGGTLNYTGPAATSDRGFTVAGDNSVLSIANDLTINGEIATTGGNFTKTGAGTFTYGPQRHQHHRRHESRAPHQ